jgi:hypothetical protein
MVSQIEIISEERVTNYIREAARLAGAYFGVKEPPFRSKPAGLSE